MSRKTEKSNNLENMVVHADITATSKKSVFDIETKTAYLSVTPEVAAKLKDFGLTEYESEGGDRFFIIRFAKSPMLYQNGELVEHGREELSERVNLETPNFSYSDVQLNIIKGYSEDYKTDFYRIQSINHLPQSYYAEMAPENPFI